MPPPSATTRMQLVVTQEFLAMVDRWRRRQPDIPNRSEAIRRMVEIVSGQDSPSASSAPPEPDAEGGV